MARTAKHHGQVGAHRVLLAAGDESICDSLRRTLFAVERVKCKSAWTLPERWTHRTRPPLLGKPHRTRFPTAPTRIIVSEGRKNSTYAVNPPHTRNSGHSLERRLRLLVGG